ncbi:uncharacterized protein LY89DRAFT_395264 [Mollisia scopiformis]|uniref:Uncharacterized protein n=1 Tax=Mollisia scopiformis TaxID=149040 RepID=A0A194XQ32_MOLSC|nr:uncharacterized protein LY89DRAFT_395264 [Mollisia scopiformis]KUJ22164.1 hypothetical protein LY89DRAFT_395264 [Mollisia scopiformis]
MYHCISDIGEVLLQIAPIIIVIQVFITIRLLSRFDCCQRFQYFARTLNILPLSRHSLQAKRSPSYVCHVPGISLVFESPVSIRTLCYLNV